MLIRSARRNFCGLFFALCYGVAYGLRVLLRKTILKKGSSSNVSFADVDSIPENF